ncbi:MAG: twin-arginine translocase subunit TatC [Steroidobacteraceae bacterium]|nr:twin-arginine translocase subunit TatC [Steroidobacteraceae bacterium]
MSEPAHDEKLGEGSLITHLLELRDRLLRAVIAVAVLALPCLWYMNEIFTFVARPLIEQLPAGATLVATSVTAPFMTPFKLALFVAVFLAMPLVLHQIWGFVAPGLYRHEKRFAMPLLLSSIVLFYTGVAFGYYVVFPVMFKFFVATTPAGVTMMTDMTQYLDFVMLLFFAFGVAFEVPIATVLLVLTGIVKVESLSKHRGYVLLGIFVVAAFLTPPDAVSQTLMALPMYVLYEGGVLASRLLMRGRAVPRDDDEQE